MEQIIHERARILRVVTHWTDAERLALVQDLLRLVQTPPPLVNHESTLSRARGLLAGDAPPLADADADRWLDEHRQERFGA